jgi:uncharacterized protein
MPHCIVDATAAPEPVSVARRSGTTTQTVRIADQTAVRDPRRAEICLVLLLSVVASGAYAILTLFTSPVSGGHAVLAHAPARLTDLVRSLLDVGFASVPVLLVGHLIHREGTSWRELRLDLHAGPQGRRDALTGAAIAAVVGALGLAFYVAAVRLGVNRTVIPVVGNGPWWSVAVLVIRAAQSAVVEEVIVVGYLLFRLRQIGWNNLTSLVASAVLRGSYHLYQGYGAFTANVVMGLAFGLWWQKGRRAVPLVIAHFLIDATVFVGYPLVRTRWMWLPH